MRKTGSGNLGSHSRRFRQLEQLEERQLLAVDLLANIDIEENARFTPRDLFPYNDQIIVRGDDGRIGPEPWILDGDPENTELLKDIRVGPFGSGPRDFVEYEGGLYFGANNGFNGYELWVTYGTRGTTNLVADIWPGSESGVPTDIVEYNGLLHFFANDGESGRELYRSDGTAIGTERIADSIEGRGGSSGERLMVVGDKMFFVSEGSIEGQPGLWTSDSTAEGTGPLVLPSINENDIDFMTPFGDRLVFESRNKLWVTDGTVDGTSEIAPGGNSLSDITTLTVDDDRLLVTNTSGLHQISADLTTSTTLAPVAAGATVADGKIYFWHTNGLFTVGPNATSTRLVGFVPFFMTEMGATFNVPGGMLFNINRTLDQYEIWVTDGTVEGTEMLDTVRDTSAEPLAGFQQIGDSIYFAATNGAFHESLWSVPAPTIEVIVEPGLQGDVNGDQIVDVADIDAVFAAVRSNSIDQVFDIDADGEVTTADGNYIVENILNTRPGDADLNGEINFADFLALSAGFGKPDSTWSSGDFDGDGSVGFPDFLVLSSNFGFAAALADADDE